MVDIKITVKSVETTDEGTLVIEMSPYPYARWIQTEALADANVAVQPYGVIMVPEAATFTPGGLTVDVEVKGYIFSVPLGTLMEADAEDQIEFISPYITVADLADVDLTNLQNGQTLIWDATNNVWVNGAGGGGAGYTEETTTYIPLQTITLTYNESEGALLGIVPLGEMPATAGEYKIQFNGNEYTGHITVDVVGDISYYDFTYQSDTESIRLMYPDSNDEPNIILTHWTAEQMPETETVTFSMIETEIEVSDGFKKAVFASGATSATMLYYVGDGTGTPSDPKNLSLTQEGEPLSVDELNNLWFNSVLYIGTNDGIFMLQLAEKSSTKILFSYFYTNYDSGNQTFDVISSALFGAIIA